MNSFAQRITIYKHSIPLDELFREIKKQTSYDIVLSSSQINLNQLVDAYFKDESLETVLKSYFHPKTGFQYRIDNKSIVIQEKGVKQSYIAGRILSSSTSQPLAGASVRLGANSVTKTDGKGFFVLDYKDDAKLQINFLGYKSVTHAVNPNSFSIIRLIEDVETVEEVVVTGIFNRSAESFTGAVTSISGAEIKKINTNSVLAAISAVEPSFRLKTDNQFGGDINRLPDVQMRGENSFPNLSGELSNRPNEPLFILDGFQVSLQRVVDLDMNLIQSVTLLKDASATAIYGSRGANGVMVITTIPPAAGKIQVTFTNDFRLNTPELSVYNLLNAREKLDFEKRAGYYTGTTNLQNYFREVHYNSRYKNVLKGIDTDWLKIPTQVGKSNRSSLRLQGGRPCFSLRPSIHG